MIHDDTHQLFIGVLLPDVKLQPSEAGSTKRKAREITMWGVKRKCKKQTNKGTLERKIGGCPPPLPKKEWAGQCNNQNQMVVLVVQVKFSKTNEGWWMNLAKLFWENIFLPIKCLNLTQVDFSFLINVSVQVNVHTHAEPCMRKWFIHWLPEMQESSYLCKPA